jgi:hypothetical protein
MGVARSMLVPFQSVRNGPGSTIVVLMPKGSTSWASDSLNPSSPHFVAW